MVSIGSPYNGSSANAIKVVLGLRWRHKWMTIPPPLEDVRPIALRDLLELDPARRPYPLLMSFRAVVGVHYRISWPNHSTRNALYMRSMCQRWATCQIEVVHSRKMPPRGEHA